MAEAHSAVAFNFSVTHEGVSIDYDWEVSMKSRIIIYVGSQGSRLFEYAIIVTFPAGIQSRHAIREAEAILRIQSWPITELTSVK